MAHWQVQRFGELMSDATASQHIPKAANDDDDDTAGLRHLLDLKTKV